MLTAVYFGCGFLIGFPAGAFWMLVVTERLKRVLAKKDKENAGSSIGE